MSVSGDAGWLYCFENLCMPGIYKIGCTKLSPDELLNVANSSRSPWGPPTPYQIVLTQKVTRVREIDRAIFTFLDEMYKAVNSGSGFYRISRSAVDMLFTLVGPLDVSGGDTIELVEDEDDDTEEIECVSCDWNGKKYQYPYHVISTHLSQIKNLRSGLGYCAYFKIKDIKCNMCLTCKKGVAFIKRGTQETIWHADHSFRSRCHERHLFEFDCLKQLWEASVASNE